MYIKIATLIWFLALVSLGAAQQGPQKQSPQKAEDEANEILVTTKLQLVRSEPLSYFSKIDLGDLTAGTQFLLKLAVENTSDEDIGFAVAGTSCNCGHATVAGNSFAANQATTVLVNFKTPESSTTSDFGISLTFGSGKASTVNSVELYLSARLAGNLLIDRSSSIFKLSPAETSTWRVKLVISDPIKLDELKIEKSKSLADVVCQIGSDEIGNAMYITAASAIVDDSGLAGTIQVIDSKSGRKSSIDIAILKASPVTISPSVLRFRKEPEGKDLQKAMALLQVPAPVKPDNQETEKPILIDGQSNGQKSEPPPPPNISITASLNGKLLEAHADRMTDRIFRIYTVCPVSDLHKFEEEKIIWSVTIDSVRHELSTTFLFED